MTTTRTKTDKLDELHERLATQVESLISGEDWKAMLDIAARLHRYSARNVMLILSQRPAGVTMVAGYRRWQSLGRQVRKGEQGIAILAPCVYRKRPIDDAAAGHDSPELTRILRGFRVAYVWDESQTDGEALPDVRPELLVGDDPAQLWAGLVAQLDGCGYTVSRGDCGGANGFTDFLARKVMVRDDVDELQAAKTLCHETAHALLHDPSQQPVARARAEVEAESVAYIVCQRAGLATTDYSLPYVARWSGGDADVVRSTADRVLGAARRILDGLGLADPDGEGPPA
ncbi:MAG: ArdC family protein [Actinomycetota bacterium]|nr:ArdC family protein [Actinomycetota bacterium]